MTTSTTTATTKAKTTAKKAEIKHESSICHMNLIKVLTIADRNPNS